MKSLPSDVEVTQILLIFGNSEMWEVDFHPEVPMAIALTESRL